MPGIRTPVRLRSLLSLLAYCTHASATAAPLNQQPSSSSSSLTAVKETNSTSTGPQPLGHFFRTTASLGPVTLSKKVPSELLPWLSGVTHLRLIPGTYPEGMDYHFDGLASIFRVSFSADGAIEYTVRAFESTAYGDYGKCDFFGSGTGPTAPLARPCLENPVVNLLPIHGQLWLTIDTRFWGRVDMHTLDTIHASVDTSVKATTLNAHPACEPASGTDGAELCYVQHGCGLNAKSHDACVSVLVTDANARGAMGTQTVSQVGLPQDKLLQHSHSPALTPRQLVSKLDMFGARDANSGPSIFENITIPVDGGDRKMVRGGMEGGDGEAEWQQAVLRTLGADTVEPDEGAAVASLRPNKDPTKGGVLASLRQQEDDVFLVMDRSTNMSRILRADFKFVNNHFWGAYDSNEGTIVDTVPATKDYLDQYFRPRLSEPTTRWTDILMPPKRCIVPYATTTADSQSTTGSPTSVDSQISAGHQGSTDIQTDVHVGSNIANQRSVASVGAARDWSKVIAGGPMAKQQQGNDGSKEQSAPLSDGRDWTQYTDVTRGGPMGKQQQLQPPPFSTNSSAPLTSTTDATNATTHVTSTVSSDEDTSSTHPPTIHCRPLLKEQQWIVDYPTYNPHVKAQPYTYFYAIAPRTLESRWFDTMIKADVTTGEVTHTWSSPGVYVTEADFVPREKEPTNTDGAAHTHTHTHTHTHALRKQSVGGGGEDDGVLLSVLYNSTSDRSMLAILDAKDLSMKFTAELPGDPISFHAHGIVCTTQTCYPNP